MVDAMIDRVLATSPETARDNCPEVADLAAWYEARDKPAGSSGVHQHLADCARCQSIIVLVSRSEDASNPAPSARRMLRLVKARIMVPALVGAVAIVGVAQFFLRPNQAVPTPGIVAGTESQRADSRISAARDAFKPGEFLATRGASSNGMEVAMAMRGDLSAALVVSPDHSVEWLLGKHGAIFRRDRQHRIQAQASGVVTDLTAGAAVSSDVCWVIGNSGTILKTTDGHNWKTLAAPTELDLISVAANSADAAMVVAAGGFTYYTADGGKTWALH
jgi:hypothetical protein